MPDAVPAATFPIYSGLGQASNMLSCIPSGFVFDEIKSTIKNRRGLTMSSAETAVVIGDGDEVVHGFRMSLVDDKLAHVQVPGIISYDNTNY